MRARVFSNAVAVWLGFSIPAFAQATFSVSSLPVMTATSSGQTERTGDITFTHVSGTSVAGTITISYGVPVTVAMSAITVAGTGGYDGVYINTGASSNLAGVLVINVPAGAGYGTIVVSGVRVAIAGTGLTNLVASISSVGNAIVAGQTSITVISSIASGIGSVGTGTTASVATIQGLSYVSDIAVITVTEGYPDAFKFGGAGDTTSVLLRITLDKAPPAPVSLTFPETAVEEGSGPGVWQSCNSTGTLPVSYSFHAGSTSLTAYYRIIAPTSPVLLETVTIPVTVTVGPFAIFPLAPTTIKYQCSLAPVGNAFGSMGQVISSPVPRFAAVQMGPVNLMKVVSPTRDIDMDGDTKSDIAVWRPDSGVWYVIPSASPATFTATQWGLPTDVPVPRDYDGDGKTDIAVWRPDSGIWYVLPSGTPGTFTSTPWGLPADIPVPGDYDGDGKADIAVWRPDSGTWYVLPSGTPGTFTSTPWGLPTDIPVPGYYDGDGKTDIAVWRPDFGTWYVLCSASPDTFITTQWGLAGDVPVAADYDGEGYVEAAVYRPSDGMWYFLLSGTPFSFSQMQWGLATDIPLSPLSIIMRFLP